MRPHLERLPSNPQSGRDHEPGPASGVRAAPVRAFPRRRLVDTSDVDEARRVFSGLYAESTLEPTRGASFRCTLDVVACGPIRVVAGSWSGGGRVVVPTLTGRYLFTLAAEGHSEGEHAGERFTVAPAQRGALFSPGRSITHRVGPSHQGRTVVIENDALAAHFRVLTGRELRAPLLFDAALNLEEGPGVTLHGIVQLFRGELERPGASPLSIIALREALFTSLLTNTRHSESALLDAPPPRVAPGSVRRAEEYIAAHAAEPITLADIVAAAGVPARSLRAAFAAFRGAAPMEFLRQRRFDLAHRRLTEATAGTTVASVVAALGLGGAGRFSVEYKKRFGKSPSETLAAGRAGVGFTLARRVIE
jgi:AraC-like DNA-binding protein